MTDLVPAPALPKPTCNKLVSLGYIDGCHEIAAWCALSAGHSGDCEPPEQAAAEATPAPEPTTPELAEYPNGTVLVWPETPDRFALALARHDEAAAVADERHAADERWYTLTADPGAFPPGLRSWPQIVADEWHRDGDTYPLSQAIILVPAEQLADAQDLHARVLQRLKTALAERDDAYAKCGKASAEMARQEIRAEAMEAERNEALARLNEQDRALDNADAAARTQCAIVTALQGDVGKLTVDLAHVSDERDEARTALAAATQAVRDVCCYDCRTALSAAIAGPATPPAQERPAAAAGASGHAETAETVTGPLSDKDLARIARNIEAASNDPAIEALPTEPYGVVQRALSGAYRLHAEVRRLHAVPAGLTAEVAQKLIDALKRGETVTTERLIDVFGEAVAEMHGLAVRLADSEHWREQLARELAEARREKSGAAGSLTAGRLAAIERRATSTHDWLRRDQRAQTGDDWLPLMVRRHFEDDMPCLFDEVRWLHGERLRRVNQTPKLPSGYLDAETVQAIMDAHQRVHVWVNAVWRQLADAIQPAMPKQVTPASDATCETTGLDVDEIMRQIVAYSDALQMASTADRNAMDAYDDARRESWSDDCDEWHKRAKSTFAEIRRLLEATLPQQPAEPEPEPRTVAIDVTTRRGIITDATARLVETEPAEPEPAPQPCVYGPVAEVIDRG